MGKIHFLSILILVILCNSSLASEHCAAPRNVIACETPVLKEVTNLDQVKKEIKKFKKSGKWDSSNECLLNKAKAILQQYIPVGDKKLAIIFDIDDTALSNWEINMTQDFGFIVSLNKAWEMSAQSKPIKQILDLYNFAKKHGFAAFFITGRNESQRASTISNLKQAGFCNWDGLYFKPIGYTKSSNCFFKSELRKKIEAMGYTIIANIGDQYSDMSGDAQAHYNFKVANPMYFIP